MNEQRLQELERKWDTEGITDTDFDELTIALRKALERIKELEAGNVTHLEVVRLRKENEKLRRENVLLRDKELEYEEVLCALSVLRDAITGEDDSDD